MRAPSLAAILAALPVAIAPVEAARAGSAVAAPPPTAPAATAPSGTTAGATDGGAIRFTDVTAQSGIALTLTSGATPSTNVLEVKGGGLALIDFDNDGDLDLFVPNGATLADPEHGPGARLFRNDGALRFTDVTAASGIAHRRWSFGAAVGDVDGDGFDDLYIACFGPDALLRNRGDGTFEDITAASGLGDPRWGTSAAFADLDADGDLDLYVCNYLAVDPAKPLPNARFKGIEVLAGPRPYEPEPDAIYENTGVRDGTVRFVDRSAESGVAAVKPGFGLNLAILDLTGDGRPDIFVGNDSQPNNLFRNEGGFRFTDDGMRSGIAVNGDGSAQATMGIAVGDIDGNGRPDVFTTNFSSDTNTLHANLDGRSFDDRTNQFGLGAPSRRLCGWGAAFVDLDHDGDEDLLGVNGHVYPNATPETMDSSYAQPPLLMERVGARFIQRTAAGNWSLEPKVDRTAVFADLDHDGDVDAVIAGLNAPLRVIRNDHDAAGDWLVVIPRDARVGNRHAIGAVVEVAASAPAGDASASPATRTVQRRWILGGGPFQSNQAPEAHFGIPAGWETVDVVVRFPDQTVVERRGVRAGQRLLIERANQG